MALLGRGLSEMQYGSIQLSPTPSPSSSTGPGLLAHQQGLTGHCVQERIEQHCPSMVEHRADLGDRDRVRPSQSQATSDLLPRSATPHTCWLRRNRIPEVTNVEKKLYIPLQGEESLG